MPNEIQAFLNKHYVLVLCTSHSDQPYSAPLFYIFFNNFLFFLSDIKTKHSQDILLNKNVSASVFTQTNEISKIQGVQILGICRLIGATKEIKSKAFLTINNQNISIWDAYHKYLEKFPIAESMDSSLWCLQPRIVKYTNNNIHFGYKKIWRIEDEISH